MTRNTNESRRRFLGLTGGLAALGLFGSGTVSADEKEGKDGKRGRSKEVTAFDVELAPENVVSDEDVESDAAGNATAVLDDQHLLIGGEFADLESRLRDLEDYDDEGFGAPDEDDEDQEEVVEDLLDPGIHIHEGGPGETTSYILALVAHLEEFDDRDARFAGSFLLSRSQIVTLENEEMHQDVHTEGFEDGELRDQISPVDRDLRLFDAELTSETAGVDAPALGKATAFLDGNELVVGGEFSGLRSELRDRTESVLDPGIQVRDPDGEAVLGLIADIEGDEGSGRFMGSFELDDRQVEALENGEYHVDVVTEDHPEGVVRGDLEER